MQPLEQETQTCGESRSSSPVSSLRQQLELEFRILRFIELCSRIVRACSDGVRPRLKAEKASVGPSEIDELAECFRMLRKTDMWSTYEDELKSIFAPAEPPRGSGPSQKLCKTQKSTCTPGQVENQHEGSDKRSKTMGTQTNERGELEFVSDSDDNHAGAPNKRKRGGKGALSRPHLLDEREYLVVTEHDGGNPKMHRLSSPPDAYPCVLLAKLQKSSTGAEKNLCTVGNFQSVGDSMKHVRTEHFYCTVCYSKLPVMNTITPSLRECVFSTLKDLKYHTLRRHAKAIVCPDPLCGRAFGTKTDFARKSHLDQHTRLGVNTEAVKGTLETYWDNALESLKENEPPAYQLRSDVEKCKNIGELEHLFSKNYDQSALNAGTLMNLGVIHSETGSPTGTDLSEASDPLPSMSSTATFVPFNAPDFGLSSMRNRVLPPLGKWHGHQLVMDVDSQGLEARSLPQPSHEARNPRGCIFPGDYMACKSAAARRDSGLGLEACLEASTEARMHRDPPRSMSASHVP